MKLTLRKTILTTLVLAFAALGPATAQAVTRSPAAGHRVPFLGVLRGVETDDGGFPFLVVQGTGTGIATQLGRFTYVNPHTVDLRTRSGCGFELDIHRGRRRHAHRRWMRASHRCFGNTTHRRSLHR